MVPQDSQKEQELVNRIHVCVKCETLVGDKRVQTNQKKIPIDYGEPYHKVKILFVAESPSTSGRYFYRRSDTTNPSTLRAELFRQMVEAGLMSQPTLEEFKLDYYLADVVKCPFMNAKNGRNSAPSPGAVENCNPFLLEEIKLIQPEIICALGKSALRGFLNESKFKLKEYLGRVPREKLKERFDKLSIPVYACYYPGAMVPWDEKIGILRDLGTKSNFDAR